MGIVAGDLKRSITIKQLSKSTDEYGSSVETYTDLVTVRAAVKYNGGTKSVDLNEIFSSQTLQFTIYYRTAINATMRVIYNTKVYRIINIAEIGYKEGMILTCELINE